MKQLITTLRAQLDGIDSVLLYYAEGVALLDYIEKLEAVVDAAQYFADYDSPTGRQILRQALAALETSNNRDEVTASREKV